LPTTGRSDEPPIDGPPIDGPPIDGPPIDGPPIDGPRLDELRGGCSRIEVSQAALPHGITHR